MSRQPISDLEALRAYASVFVSEHPNGGKFGLVGDLGVGKTEFVRQCITVLADRAQVKVPRVMSPSFVIHQSYAQVGVPVEHFDFYRLEAIAESDLIELGYLAAIENVEQGNGYLFVEWPEKVKDRSALLLDKSIKIELENGIRHFSRGE